MAKSETVERKKRVVKTLDQRENDLKEKLANVTAKRQLYDIRVAIKGDVAPIDKISAIKEILGFPELEIEEEKSEN